LRGGNNCGDLTAVILYSRIEREVTAMENAIMRVEIKDFLVFKGDFAADFCSGVNVFIGGNGSGKTTLLRALTFAVNENGVTLSNAIAFGNAEDILYDVFAAQPIKPRIKPETMPTSLAFIPSYFDTNFMIKSNMKIKDICELTKQLIDRISDITKIKSTDTSNSFRRYIERTDDVGKILVDLEASGYQKLALIFQLLKNGWLESGSVFLWDEPENSLNPELVPVVVNILLEIVKNGVQIFLATHDYNIARYFDVRKDKSIPVMFHNLSKTDSRIVIESSPEYLKLPNNLLESASSDLFKAVVESQNQRAYPNRAER
jgi:predicted ATP-dependent endonuclease of OLD family